ncbi:unnamed protein product [Closterium sp. NIES-65]|nr:unnamed protein product [Closterium sp. NIES-65]
MAASDVAATPGVQTGKVKWFNSTKGFGFITPDDGGEELFVHQTSIKAEGFRSLDENEVVEFTIETSEDGRTKAVNVTGPAGSYVKGAPRRDGYGGGGGRFGGGGFGGRGGGRFGGGRGGGRFGGGPGACYNCNMPGHLARDCPTPGMGGGAGGGAPRTCYTCNQPGHIALSYHDCQPGNGGRNGGTYLCPYGTTREEGERPSGTTRREGERPSGTTRGEGERPCGATRGEGERPSGATRGEGERTSGTTRGEGERPSCATRGEEERLNTFVVLFPRGLVWEGSTWFESTQKAPASPPSGRTPASTWFESTQKALACPPFGRTRTVALPRARPSRRVRPAPT